MRAPGLSRARAKPRADPRIHEAVECRACNDCPVKAAMTEREVRCYSPEVALGVAAWNTNTGALFLGGPADGSTASAFLIAGRRSSASARDSWRAPLARCRREVGR